MGAASAASTGGGSSMFSGAMGIAGALMGGQAAQGMTTAQFETAKQQQNLALDMASPSPEQIQNMQQQTDIAQANLTRQKAILDSADPAMMELGKQTLAMLQGNKQVGTNATMQRQIQQQRTQLQNKLQAQLGPGWQQTTAGQQAMSQFDANAASGLQVNQQNQINNNLGHLAPISANGLGQSAAMFGGINNQYQAQNALKAGIVKDTAGNIIKGAGANQTTDMGIAGSLGNLAPFLQKGWSALSGLFSGAGSSLGSYAGSFGEGIGASSTAFGGAAGSSGTGAALGEGAEAVTMVA